MGLSIVKRNFFDFCWVQWDSLIELDDFCGVLWDSVLQKEIGLVDFFGVLWDSITGHFDFDDFNLQCL